MKRDPEYELALLKKIEGEEVYMFPFVYGMDEETKKEWDHLQLLFDQGLVTKEGSTWRLTYKGHEALELESQGLIKRAIKEHGDVAALTILIEFAKMYLTGG